MARDARTKPVRRSVARLAAVQALYQMALGGITADDAIAQFTGGKPGASVQEEPDLAGIPAPDTRLFGAIVRGVDAARDDLDRMIGAALTTEWQVERLELLVRLILEAGVWELTACPDVPPRVAIDEYVNVTHAFYDGAEPGLVNGVLDAVARSYRAEEMAAARG